MIFKEKQLEAGWAYETTDVFGTITITSDKQQLGKEDLDTIVLGVLKSGSSEGQITSTISFKFEKAPAWMPEDETAALKPGQCGTCHGFRTIPYPRLTFIVGAVLTAISFVLTLIMPPIGIVASMVGLGMMVLGPIIMRLSDKGKTLYCQDCRRETPQAAASPTT